MEILKSKLEVLLKELPDKVDIDEVMYRIYLLQKKQAKRILGKVKYFHIKMLSKGCQRNGRTNMV
jgi:hypothetical protein